MSYVMTTLTAAVQGAAGVYASFQIERTMKREAELLADKSGLDKEVLERDEASAAKAAAYLAATKWSKLGRGARTLLKASTVLMVASCYLLSFVTCFEELGLTDTVRCQLNGHGHKLIKPAGWVALALFCCSVALLQLFGMHAKRLAQEHGAVDVPEEEPPSIESAAAVNVDEEVAEVEVEMRETPPVPATTDQVDVEMQQQAVNAPEASELHSETDDPVVEPTEVDAQIQAVIHEDASTELAMAQAETPDTEAPALTNR